MIKASADGAAGLNSYIRRVTVCRRFTVTFKVGNTLFTYRLNVVPLVLIVDQVKHST
jgi:hypothetical protein